MGSFDCQSVLRKAHQIGCGGYCSDCYATVFTKDAVPNNEQTSLFRTIHLTAGMTKEMQLNGIGRGSREPNRKLWIARLALAITSCVITIEVCAQIFTLYLRIRADAVRAEPNHYYTESDDAILAYELAANKRVNQKDRVLQLNRYGIRDSTNELHIGKRKVALLGDSVTFGTGHSQEATIGAMLQRKCSPNQRHIKVLNFGTPGYGAEELVRFLQLKDELYSTTDVIYIFNANDFCRRDSMYEGGDNGLYRMYKPPWFGTLWLIRKAIYRSKKGGPIYDPNPVSVDWYRWIYHGNRDFALRQIAKIRDYCEAKKIRFTLVLLPAGCAFVGESYALSDVYSDIGQVTSKAGIRTIDATEFFASDPARFFDNTDHLSLAGNELLAEVILREVLSDVNGDVSTYRSQ